MNPEVQPEGAEGVFGALLLVIATDRTSEYPDEAPLLSTAIALTRYVPLVLQLWDALAIDPELTGAVCEVVPSPQLNM